MGASTDARDHFTGRLPAMAAAIERLVVRESPSSDIGALEDCARELAAYAKEMTDGDAVWHATGPEERPHLQIDLGDRPDVLLIGHFDTVHPVGTLDAHPLRVDGDRLYGPGALDMKAGVVVLLEVAHYLQRSLPRPNVRIFLDSDEEIGSTTSGPLLRQLAHGARVGLVFESTTEEGALKIGARGSRVLQVVARGRGGHAAYPEEYHNPVLALAHVIAQTEQQHRPDHGIVVAPTMLHGAAAWNTVPDEASAHFCLRGTSEALLDQAEQAIRAIRPLDDNIQLHVERLVQIPTFEPRDDNAAFLLAVRAASELGMAHPRGIEARGASDANQIAAVVPGSIEGLGGWGHGLHDPEREHVLLSSLAPSAALAARICELALSDSRVP